MAIECFLDTNILLYGFDLDAMAGFGPSTRFYPPKF
jgi:hypothetical protein